MCTFKYAQIAGVVCNSNKEVLLLYQKMYGDRLYVYARGCVVVEMYM